MRLPDRVQDITVELYNRNLALAHGDDDQRRQLARMIAEQARYELGPSWGHKRADPGRPPSKDAIAQQQPDGKLFAWDLFNGATREPNADPESIDITGQTFIVVPPVNHLGIAPDELPNVSPDEPPTVPSGSDVAQIAAAVLAELKRLGDAVEQTNREIEALRAKPVPVIPTVTFPDYTGTLPFGLGTVVLKPR